MKTSLDYGELSGKVIGCAIAVHAELGPGFLESIYENALRVELGRQSVPFRYQEEVAIMYAAKQVGMHRLDLVVGDKLVVELKAIKALEDIHFAQVRSYLKALGLNHGLLFNFNSIPLTIKRVIYTAAASDA